MKEKQARVEEQTRIYDRITYEMTKQLDELDCLLQELKNNPEKQGAILPKICVISAYVKRRGNLLLLGEDNSSVSAKELEYCLRESANNILLNSVLTSLDCNCQGVIPVDYAVAVYDIFEELIEQGLSSMNALIINLKISNGELSFVLGIGSDGINPPDCSAIETLDGKATFESDNTDTCIRIRIPKGGLQ